MIPHYVYHIIYWVSGFLWCLVVQSIYRLIKKNARKVNSKIQEQ